jgi:hypothetical protein
LSGVTIGTAIGRPDGRAVAVAAAVGRPVGRVIAVVAVIGGGPAGRAIARARR